MAKKAKEYKPGDFCFAKVKGYPAWPARIRSYNGKKYLVYFYGTGETANLPANMIFDYAENKEKFGVNIKRKFFNEGLEQIEYDITNNIPLPEDDGAGPTINDSQVDDGDKTVTEDNETAENESALEADKDTAKGEKATDKSEAGVDDSDEGQLVIDEGKKDAPKRKGRTMKGKSSDVAVTPKSGKKEKHTSTPVAEDVAEAPEIISRSGRKIRPKRFLDAATEENTTLPSPVPAKKTPKEKTSETVTKNSDTLSASSIDQNGKHFHTVHQSDIEDLKEPFSGDATDLDGAGLPKQNILIARLPSGSLVGIKLFQNRPASYKDDAARIEWDNRAAKNAIALKKQLERGEVEPTAVQTQLEMDLNLSEEERTNLDKEKENEKKRNRIEFLQCEMKLVELDAKIKSCLGFQRADVEQCSHYLDQLVELEVKPIMLLKHPTVLETVKRLRAYVGNTAEWKMNDEETLEFKKKAHLIRQKAQEITAKFKCQFELPIGLSFWEGFADKVLRFKKATNHLTAEQVLELTQEPPSLSEPNEFTCAAAITAAANHTDSEMEHDLTEGDENSEKRGKKRRVSGNGDVLEEAELNNKQKKVDSGAVEAKPPSKRKSKS